MPIKYTPHIPSNISYKTHLCRQCNRWSLRCSWSTACWCCSNYIFILNLTPGFNGLGRDYCRTRRDSFEFWDQVCLILESLRYVPLLTRLRRGVVIKVRHLAAINDTAILVTSFIRSLLLPIWMLVGGTETSFPGTRPSNRMMWLDEHDRVPG